jgi:hypothetical protein
VTLGAEPEEIDKTLSALERRGVIRKARNQTCVSFARNEIGSSLVRKGRSMFNLQERRKSRARLAVPGKSG